MDKLVYIFIGLAVLALPFGLYYAVKDQQRWEAWCHSEDGHVKKTDSVGQGFGYDSKGNYVPTTTYDTTYYCLTSDGRILDIKD